MSYAEVDWELVHKEKLFTVDKCWTTCNGGFCCSNNYPDFGVLRFVPTKGTTIFYMESEYNYLLQRKRVHPGMARVLTLDFGTEKPLKFIYIACHDLGLCKGKYEPPLFCKLYPLLPIFSIEGEIEELFLGSIYELTFKVRGDKSPCTIENQCVNFYRDIREFNPLLFQLLTHPYIILHTRIAKAFADIYLEKLKSNKELMSLEGRAFWEKWEQQYLTGRLTDMDVLKRNVSETYKKLKHRYKGFAI